MRGIATAQRLARVVVVGRLGGAAQGLGLARHREVPTLGAHGRRKSRGRPVIMPGRNNVLT